MASLSRAIRRLVSNWSMRAVGVAVLITLIATLLAPASAVSAQAAPGVTITESGGSTDIVEGGANDAYAVALDSQPAGDVTVVMLIIGSQVSVSPGFLTFTTSNWNTAQTVTVAAVDDQAVEGDHDSTINHMSLSFSDPTYNGIAIADVVAHITDNDPDIEIVKTADDPIIVRGGDADFTITVTNSGSVPLTGVTVTDALVPACNNGIGTLASGASVSYSCTAVGLTSSLTNTANVAGTPPVGANETDSDSARVDVVAAAFTVSPAGVTVSETGSSGSISVALSGRPDSTVIISVSSGDTGEVTVASSSLLFDATNWGVQSVRVNGVDDRFVDGDQVVLVRFSVRGGSDSAFLGLADQAIQVTNLDDELGSRPAQQTPSTPQLPEPNVIPDDQIEPADPGTGLVEVVHPDEPHVIELEPGVVLRLPATVRQSSVQVRLQRLGLQSQSGPAGQFLQNIALNEVDPSGFGAPGSQPPGQVIRAVQLDLFDMNANLIEDIRLFQGVKIEMQLTDLDMENLGGFGAVISGHMLGRLQIHQFTPSDDGGTWSRIHTAFNLTDRIVLATTFRLSTFALVWADIPSFGGAGTPAGPRIQFAGLPPLPCPGAWRAAQAC